MCLFQAEDGIRDLVRSRGLGDVYKRQNLAKRHRRPTQTTEGGIFTFAAPLHHSKVMLIDPTTGAPTRIRRQKDADGTVERIAIKSGAAIPRTR